MHRAELKSQLRRRGYSGKKIERQLQPVDMLKRDDLLQTKLDKKAEERVPLVVFFFETASQYCKYFTETSQPLT